MWKIPVAQQRSQVTEHLRRSKNSAAVVGLEYRPGRLSLIGESSATSSSETPKWATVATAGYKLFVSVMYHFLNEKKT
jgi:hypothetical protein